MGDLIPVAEGNAHETVAQLKGPIDVVFIDADKAGYLDYSKKVFPLVRPGGLILDHNMNQRMADPAFVKEITTNPDVETLYYTAGGGLGITLKNGRPATIDEASCSVLPTPTPKERLSIAPGVSPG